MAVICSVEFPRTGAGKSALARMVVDLLDADRQFSCVPTFDPPGYILSWPGAPGTAEPPEPTPA